MVHLIAPLLSGIVPKSAVKYRGSKSIRWVPPSGWFPNALWFHHCPTDIAAVIELQGYDAILNCEAAKAWPHFGLKGSFTQSTSHVDSYCRYPFERVSEWRSISFISYLYQSYWYFRTCSSQSTKYFIGTGKFIVRISAVSHAIDSVLRWGIKYR